MPKLPRSSSYEILEAWNKNMAASSGGSTTRAFAIKLNKDLPAAEVRKHVSTSFGGRPQNPSNLELLASGAVPLTEVVDPLDFENFILQHQPIIENDPVSRLLDFPDDDVEITTIPRQCRTLTPYIPKDPGADTDPHVKDCIRTYTSDWAIVNRRYQFHGTEEGKPDSRRRVVRSNSFASRLPKHTYEVDEKNKSEADANRDARGDVFRTQESEIQKSQDFPRGSWAMSIFDLQSSTPDALLPTLLDHIPAEEMDCNNEKQRKVKRINSLMSLYPQKEDGIVVRTPPALAQEHFGQRLLVKVLALKMELDVEPIFATMALYDGRVKKKISENFHFDMNSEWTKKLIGAHNPRSDISALSRTAIFSITYPSTDVFLVIKLEKVLQQGDISECAEPYMKESDNAKNRDKVRAHAIANCERLGKYRMPFAWTAIHLIDVISGASSLDGGASSGDSTPSGSQRKSVIPSGSDTPTSGSNKASMKSGKDSVSRKTSVDFRRSMYVQTSLEEPEPLPDISNFKPVTLTVSSFFKQESDRLADEDLYKFLADLKRPSSVLKRLKNIPSTLKLDISVPSEKPAYCLTSEMQQVHPYPDSQSRPTKEIEEFAPKEVFAPYLTYKNLLYVYPMSANFSSRGGTANRNIAVKVQFMAGEEQSQALECIFGKSSTTVFATEAWTSVTYHSKSPVFYEEIKIKLPAHLTDQHHLLFTFYHISCTPKKQEEKTNIEIPIGYTWIPALKDGRLQLGELDLPVSIDKPHQNYSILSPEIALPNIKWIDGHKGVFHVVVRASSSVHTQEPHIHKFMKLCHQIDGRAPLPSGNAEGSIEANLKKIIMDLAKAKEEPLVRFLHLTLDKLIWLLVKPTMISGTVVNIGQTAFESLALIVQRLHKLLEALQDTYCRNDLLASYVTYVFSAPYSPSPDSSPELMKMGGHPPTRPVSVSLIGMPSLGGGKLSSSDPDIKDEAMTKSATWMEGSVSAQEMHLQGGRNDNRGCLSNLNTAHRSSSKKLVHEEIALQWAVASSQVKQIAMSHAWFFFDLMVKSMAQHLDNTDKLFWPRDNRFPIQFLDDIKALVHSVTGEIISKHNEDFPHSQMLNSYLAFFLYDIFSYMDRGFVLCLIKDYFKEVSPRAESESSLAQLKLELLCIICSHEHYVTLNLPFPTQLFPSPPPSPTASDSSQGSSFSLDNLPPSMAELSITFRQQHFLAGLFLGELSMALEGSDIGLQCKAIEAVKNLLTCHDLDQRFDESSCRAHIAALYLPLLGIVVEALPQLHGIIQEESNSSFNPAIANAISSSSIPMMRTSNEDYKIDLPSQKQKQQPAALGPEATRNVLLCFLWVIKNMDHGVLRQWWAEQSEHRLSQLLEVLDLCVSVFEYRGKKEINQRVPAAQSTPNIVDNKQRLEDAIMGGGAAMYMRNRHRLQTAERTFVSPLAETRRWKKEQTQWKQTAEQMGRNNSDCEVSAQIEGVLVGETGIILLDTLELIVQTISNSESLRSILSAVLRVLLHALGCNQSEWVLQNIFATQRSIVYKFPELLFQEDTELCADLCSRLLNHCSSSISIVRAHAAASLYLLMRQNFEIGNNFARVKMQVTMSLSSLVGTSQTFNEEYLRRSLKTIITYAESDHDLRSTTFPEQVRELVFNLHMILSDTVKMKEFKEDHEMQIDLMYRIAKGYQNSPDLRQTWLENMAAKHNQLKNHTEAALCLVHSAALVAEYLNMLEDKTYLPIGCVAFEKVSPNVLEESAVSDDVVSPDEEGICTGRYFSEAGLVGLLEQAANCFTMAQMYECVNELYKVLIPIHEANREHKRLATIHKKLSDAFEKIIQTEGKRMMGTYFRVGFYGAKFGDLDGEEFVYKEPAITKLPEVSHRLQGFYIDRFGEGVIEVLKDSNAVDTSQMDPEKAYIQITYVEPYFDDYEMKERKTYFDKNYNIRRFMFATPFTPGGKAHGDLANQYKRKTILTVANAFPYVKTRISVVHREQIVLSPIEVAIEDIQSKTEELTNAHRQDPPDAKMLQMVLQGCIGTTVNQGPLEMATTFLSAFSADSPEKEVEPQQISRHHQKLRLCFKEFVKRCDDAVRKNRGLVGPNQHDYQKSLEANNRQLSEKLDPLLQNRFSSLRGSLRKTRENAVLRKISTSFGQSQR